MIDTFSFWGSSSFAAFAAHPPHAPRRPRPARARRPRRPLDASSEKGYTLIELLVTALLSIVVVGGVLSALETSQRVQARDTEWALTLQEGRAGLARMSREIRQASKVETAEQGTIVFLANIGTKEWKLKYACGVSQSGTAYDECLRYGVEGKSGTLPSTGTPVIRDVLNGSAVFKYFKANAENTSAPTLVTLKIELPSKGTLQQAGLSSATSHNAVLENAAFMRNLELNG